MCPEQGTGEGGEGGLGVYRPDPRDAFHARPQVSCFQGSGLGFRVWASGFRVQVWGLGFLCEEARSRSSLRRSTPHRQDCSSIGCLQCITTTSTGIG